MENTMLFGKDLERHARRLRECSHETLRTRGKQKHCFQPLRSRPTWTAIRTAQRWIMGQPVPGNAWEGERVRRTALQIGQGRPLLAAVLREEKSDWNQISGVDLRSGSFIVLNPQFLASAAIPVVAGGLIHEATHMVHREMVCERYGFAPMEALVLYERNQRAAKESVFTMEALAFWNQAGWLLNDSRKNSESELESDHLIQAMVRTMNQEGRAMEELVDYLLNYTLMTASHRHAEYDFPLVHLAGRSAGLPIHQADVAPRILLPLYETLMTKAKDILDDLIKEF